LTKESKSDKILIYLKGRGMIWLVMSRRTQEVIIMCEHKFKTEVDGRFAYQVCETCDEIVNLIYLGPAPKKGENEEFDDSLIGI
jgi:hypothetical protein